MSFFEQVASFLFEKPTERLITTNTFLDPTQKQWLAFLRKDIPKNRITYEIQDHFREKLYKVCHTGTSTVKVYFVVELEEEDETGGSLVLFSILGTKKGERVLRGKYECKDPESFQIFGDLMHEFAERLAENLFFQSQQSEPFSANIENIQLTSDPEFIPVQLQEVVHECVIHNQVEGIYVAFLQSGADRATVIKTLVQTALEVGLDVDNQKKSLVVITSPGKTDKLECKIGLNKSGERIFQGKYDSRDSSVVFGTLLENFSIFLAKNQYLKSQVEITENPTPEKSPNMSPNPSPTKPEKPPLNLPKKERYDVHPTTENPNLGTVFPRSTTEDEEEPPNLFAPKSVPVTPVVALRIPGPSTVMSRSPASTGTSRPPPSTGTSRPPPSTGLSPSPWTGLSRPPPSTGLSQPSPWTGLSRPPPSTVSSQLPSLTFPVDPADDEPSQNLFASLFSGTFSADLPDQPSTVSSLNTATLVPTKISGPSPKRTLFDEDPVDDEPSQNLFASLFSGTFSDDLPDQPSTLSSLNTPTLVPTKISGPSPKRTLFDEDDDDPLTPPPAGGYVTESVAASVTDDTYLLDDDEPPPNLFGDLPVPVHTTQPPPTPVPAQTHGVHEEEEPPLSVVPRGVVPGVGLSLATTVGQTPVPSPSPMRLQTSDGFSGKNIPESDQKGGSIMNFLKGVLSNEPEIKDEDDYRPSKKKQPAIAPPPEEEVDEEVLNSMPNPIWG